MAGKGPPPKKPADRRRTNTPAGGEWRSTPGVGWQHGKPPPPPKGLKVAFSRATWRIWMGGWFAAHWLPEDVPGLYLTIQLFDLVQCGDVTRAGELRQMMDNYGITPKGQQDRRWAPPKEDEKPATAKKSSGRYDHLRVV